MATRTNNSLNTTFEYDNYNLLKKINWPGSVNTQFVSDATGNRLRMTTSTGAQYDFMYDTTAGIPAVLMEKTGTDPARLYIRTPDGRLIARVTANITSPALDFYYHFDGLGSTLALTDSTGAMTDHYEYNGWGQVMDHMGSSTQPYEFVGQLGYYAHNQDMQFSAYFRALQLGVRYYVPWMGRFTQRDPVQNYYSARYIYGSNCPFDAVDPEGRQDRRIRIPPGGGPPGYGIFGSSPCQWGDDGEGPPRQAPPRPNIRGLSECLVNRHINGLDRPHNCWYQLSDRHTNGWLTNKRCDCEDMVVCWRRLSPRTTNSDLYLDWLAYCRALGRSSDPAYGPGTRW